MKDAIKALCPQPVWKLLYAVRGRWFTGTYSRKSYAQEGEDIVLERFLGERPNGFYVDIGAHHPARFSNTYRLYKRGWRGINVDAAPGSMDLFKKVRPRDINVEAALGVGDEKLTFYVFNEPALNTLDKDLAAERISPTCKLLKEVPITTVSLAQLLNKHLPSGTAIDILSVDVEGLDEIVLRSNDWSRYRPGYILVECPYSMKPEEMSSNSLYLFLLDQGYQMVAKTKNTLIFGDPATASS